MAITRRQFLKRTGLATAGAVTIPSLFSHPFVRRAFADTIGNKYLIVIFLDGGNDGLNTVVPAGNATDNLRDAYDTARGANPNNGGLGLSVASLGPTAVANDPISGTPLALHPGLIGLKNLYDNYSNVAVVQGCGYPDYNLSHELSRIIWQTASPTTQQPYGWAGRHLMGEYDLSHIPAVCIGNTIAPEYKQLGTNVLAINRLNGFDFPGDDAYSGDNGPKQTAFSAIHAAAEGTTHPLSQTMGVVGAKTLQATLDYNSLHADWNAGRSATIINAYDDAIDNGYGGGIATRLREISKMVYGVEQGAPGVDCHFFQLGNGGYDTHSDQGTVPQSPGDEPQHWVLHRELGDSLELFHNDMIDMGGGVDSRYLVVVWSEFSRRIEQNANGTDHGSQGPMFVVGGGVNGGVYGNHADIRVASQDNGGNTVYTQNANPYRSTDFRDVFGTILKHWVGMTQGDVQLLMPVDTIGSAMDYWHTSNFNMGFLP